MVPGTLVVAVQPRVRELLQHNLLEAELEPLGVLVEE